MKSVVLGSMSGLVFALSHITDFMRIQWPKHLEQRWHRECRDGWPHERFAYLIGHKAADLVEIEHLFIPADVAAHANAEGVYTPIRWYHEALDEAAQEAAQVVGDIHSHPRTYYRYPRLKKGGWQGQTCEAVPSEKDYSYGWAGVLGITAAAKQKSGGVRCRTRFYPPAERITIL